MTARPLNLWELPGDVDNPVGRVTSVWKAQIDKDIALRQAVMVVELVFGDGTRFRAATELLEIADKLGADRWVAPALMGEVEVVNDYDLDNASSAARGFTFEVPAWFVRPRDRQINGFPLSGYGEVSLLVDGMSWNNRRVILRGDMSGGVSYGPVRENLTTKQGQSMTCDAGIVSLKLQDPRESADTIFPPYLIDTQRWPDAPINGIGQAYPIAWGQGISVCPAVDTGEFIIVTGHDWEILDVFRGNEVVASFTTSLTSDSNGVSVITIVSVAGGPVGATEEIKAQFVSTKDPAPDLLVVIRDALERYGGQEGLLVNPTLFGDAQAKLGPTTIQAQANHQSTILQFIEADLLDDFPMISMVWQGGRYGPIVTDFRGEPRKDLICGTDQLLFRIGEPTESPKGQVFNNFTLRYAYDMVLDTFTKVLVRDPTNSRLCAISLESAGARPHPLIESINIVEDAVAGYVLDWMEHHLTLQSSFVEYGAPGSQFLELRRGDTVSLTDPDHGWFGVVATIERIVYQRGMTTIGLRMWQNAFRTGRFPPAP